MDEQIFKNKIESNNQHSMKCAEKELFEVEVNDLKLQTKKSVEIKTEQQNNLGISPDSDNDHNIFIPLIHMDESEISDLSNYDTNEKNQRRFKSNPESWKGNLTKTLRAKGLPYKNKKKICPAKAPKGIDCTNCKFKCTTHFTEENRRAICKTYWGFADYKRQKDFIIKCVQTDLPKRRKKDVDSEKARQISKSYFLENSSGKHRVCAKFFEKTLCISNGPVNTAIQGKSTVGCYSGSDMRGRKTPGNKIDEKCIAMIKKHIESFPTMESHYVGASTKRFYLDSSLSIHKMYDLYKEVFCKQNNITPVSEKTYRRIFTNNYNYSFFKPK